jgi:hypothetical protein
LSRLRLEIDSLLSKGAIEVLHPPVGPGFYSSVFVVAKKSPGKFRLVINLKPLNALLVHKRFRMETQRSITSALNQGDWVISLDLTDAYLHIPIHKTCRKYLRFVHGTQVFQFRALPFGLASAPYVFTRVAAGLARVAHRRALFLYLYLDDWLLQNPIREALTLQIPVLTQLTH